MNLHQFFLTTLVLTGVAGSTLASSVANAAESPGAAARSNSSNFKDMVLAVCIARAYQAQSAASADAASSARSLVDWTFYEAEKSADEIDRLVKKYIGRDYRNPLAVVEQRDIQFNLLKCLDLYHSKELNVLVKRVVLQPNSKARQ